jgi:hypothetical protein
MKKRKRHQINLTVLLLIVSLALNAQVDERTRSLVTKNDGTEYSGYIIQEDPREILIRTDNVGEIYIPKHEIRSIRELKENEYKEGKYVGDNILSSRYFLSANALPLKKGDSYAMIQLPGAEYQVALIDNLTIGGMSSWIGVPIVATARYSVEVIDNLSIGAGIMAGTGSWASLGSYGLLPYGAVTVGNQRMNLNFSGGFLNINISGVEQERSWSDPLFSIGGFARLSERVSFVGDSFIYAKDGVVAVIVPGLRFDRSKGGAFQFGLAGLVVDGDVFPFPLPMLSWLIDI